MDDSKVEHSEYQGDQGINYLNTFISL